MLENSATDKAVHGDALAAEELQRIAGTNGRRRGHAFEEALAISLTSLNVEELTDRADASSHLVVGDPANELARYILANEAISEFIAIRAWWVGGLATSGLGDRVFGDRNMTVSASKSDIIVEFQTAHGPKLVGVGVKTCFHKNPTNAQLYFGTATSFCRLLRNNGFAISGEMEVALRMFCGDEGFRPSDSTAASPTRVSDPSRWYWEELPQAARTEWENLLDNHTEGVTRVLMQKAYLNDPLEPDYILHLRTAYTNLEDSQLAIYSVDEFVKYSAQVGRFDTRPYVIHKGSFKHDNTTHLAPRFGVVQFQRGGQKQHPTQLQFNLKAGYFNSFPQMRPDSVNQDASEN